MKCIQYSDHANSFNLILNQNGSKGKICACLKQTLSVNNDATPNNFIVENGGVKMLESETIYTDQFVNSD